LDTPNPSLPTAPLDRAVSHGDQNSAQPNPRRFSSRQRAAICLAADGCCEKCGIELQAGWHADHITPHSAGGLTDVVNGQALCPSCNLKKGKTMPLRPRGWQQRFIAKYTAHSGPDFLCVACPGAGKTHAAAFVAADLLRDGIIDRILVVVPTFTLREQWANAFALHGILIDADTMNEKTDKRPRNQWLGELSTKDMKPVSGWAITYSSLAANPTYHRILNSRRRTLVILDEAHHLGDEGAWGKAAEEALSVCVRRLSLSGTPFRSDKARIPFATYYPSNHERAGWVRFTDDEFLGPFPGGFDYSYGTALSERPSPVRPAVFEMFDGDVAWFDAKDFTDRKVRLSQVKLAKDLRRKANRMVLDPAGQWLESALRAADERLTSVRAEGDPDAKGLVVCLDMDHAYAVADVLTRVTGVRNVPVAASKDANGMDNSERARAVITAFGEGRDRWLVAVAMVSEGVDIPQLRVGVYATNKRTDLFFRQVLGRFVRVRSDLPADVDQTAYMFVPKEEHIIALADAVTGEINDSVLAWLDDDNDEPKKPRDSSSGQPSLFGDTFQESTGEAAGFLLPGAGTFDHDEVGRLAEESGRPAGVVLDVMQAMQRIGFTLEHGVAPAQQRVPQQPAAAQEPWKVRAGARRASLNKVVNQVAARRIKAQGGGQFPVMVQHVWAEVKRRSDITDLDRCDIPQLDRAIEVVRDMWKSM
jgi:superfamily II DNA or RNA helicase